jgi:hypothetical protein
MSTNTASSTKSEPVLTASIAEGVVALPRGRTRMSVIMFNQDGGSYFLNGWQNTPFNVRPAELLRNDWSSLIEDLIGKGLLSGSVSEYTVNHPCDWTHLFDVRKWGDLSPLIRLQLCSGQNYRHNMQTDEKPSGML